MSFSLDNKIDAVSGGIEQLQQLHDSLTGKAQSIVARILQTAAPLQKRNMKYLIRMAVGEIDDVAVAERLIQIGVVWFSED